MSETADDPALGHEDAPTAPGAAQGRRPVTDGQAPERAPARADRPRRVLQIVALALLVLVVDQLSKMWAQSTLTSGAAAEPLIGELIQLRLIYNSGAALSFGSGMTWLLTLVSVAVVVGIVVLARSVRSRLWGVALGLVLGGALGNLTDRLLREPGFPQGHVVDFIDYGPFVGNVADIAIVGAAIGIALLTVVGVSLDGAPRTDVPDADDLSTADAKAAADDADPAADDAGTAEDKTARDDA